MNSIVKFIMIVLVGCLFSAVYILLKYRSCVESLNMQSKKELSSRVMILIACVITSLMYGVVISCVFVYRPEISPEGEIRPLLFGIGGLLMVCAIVKGIIAGNSIKKIAADPKSRQLSLVINKIAIVELPQIIGLIIFLYRVLG